MLLFVTISVSIFYSYHKLSQVPTLSKRALRLTDCLTLAAGVVYTDNSVEAQTEKKSTTCELCLQ